ncbi:hypothetical protein KIH39_26465 [Telmatocola sphagniphila]|uniref:Terminase n=1 Tax=Telmatocola sphagniphila TaxID=1123043 RepID=A0A8E6B6S9_9BACT|nr:hypothetical protein [Telmatocola sphagniphila]QVL32334.1 hypothetical protein KIH39_26465 [Telmatocola sphagniphila]
MLAAKPLSSDSSSSRKQQERELLRLDRELLIRSARSNFAAYATAINPSTYRYDCDSHFYGDLYSHVDAFAHGEIPLLIIEAPAGTGKSETVSQLLPTFLAGNFPNDRTIAAAHTASLAEEQARAVKMIIEPGIEKADPLDIQFSDVFPHIKLGSSRTGRRSDRTRQDLFDYSGFRGGYTCAGVDGPISGRRAKWLLLDDPIKDRLAADSPVHREHVWRWYTDVFRRRGTPNWRMCIVSTRWHLDDLVGRIRKKAKENPKVPQPVVLTFQSLKTQDPRIEPRPNDKRKEGEALVPWIRSKEQLEEERALEPRAFAALDQQLPEAEGGYEFNADWFEGSDLWFDQFPRGDLTFTGIALDPSLGRNAKHGDYSAYVLLASDDSGTLWVEGDLARRPTTTMVDDGLDLAVRFQRETGRYLDGFGCETVGFQELLQPLFDAPGMAWITRRKRAARKPVYAV